MWVSALRLLIVAGTVVLAGCGGAGQAPSSAADGGGSGRGSEVEVTAGDLFYEPEQLSATPGTVTITLDNEGAIEHDVVIEEAGDTLVVEAPPGERDTGTISLGAGSYTFYCAVPGHRAAGMEGTLAVD